jgi:lambda repressor-like predicted transcriptional regulator
VILTAAVKKFPDRKQQMPELCRHVISKMTTLYCEAVKSGKIKADAVVREHCGGMADLLHSLLVYNDDGSHGGFESLSREARQTYEAARNSEEWARLEKAIADVQVEMQPNGTGADRLRTDGKQTESSRAQNSEKSASNAESAADARLGRKWRYTLSESEVASLEAREKLTNQLEHDGAKNLNVYPGAWQSEKLGRRIVCKQGSKVLYGPAAARELLAWLEARKVQGPLVIEAELPPFARSETQEPTDYYKEMERVHAIPNDDVGLLSYGRAWPHVRDLAAIEKKLPYTNKPLELEAQREKLRKILLEGYREVAEKIGLHRVSGRRAANLAEIDWSHGFEWKSRDATESPKKAGELIHTENEKVKQGNAEADFGDVLTAIGGEVLASGIGGGRRGWISATRGSDARMTKTSLKALLKQRGLSTHGWATQAGVDFHTADDYLKGKTKPYPDTLKKLADALGIKVEELLPE